MWKIWAFKSSTFLAENTTGWCFAGNKGEKTYIYSSALRESLLDPPITSGWILYFWMLLLDLQSPILTDLQESRYFYLSIFAVALFIFVLVQSLEKTYLLLGCAFDIQIPNLRCWDAGGGFTIRQRPLRPAKRWQKQIISVGGVMVMVVFDHGIFLTHTIKKKLELTMKKQLCWFFGIGGVNSTSKWHWNESIWSNYSDLTRPGPPNGGLISKGNPRKFQENLGEGEILFHLTRINLINLITFMATKKQTHRWMFLRLFPSEGTQEFIGSNFQQSILGWQGTNLSWKERFSLWKDVSSQS